MARHESDREDLFAELTALNPRLELRISDAIETVCAGRRESTASWSLFFGPDRIYHFDSSGRLRRAFVAGFLYRSEGDTLSRIRRKRTPTETILQRVDLTSEELAGFVQEMRATITGLVAALTGMNTQVLRQHPSEGEGLEMLRVSLQTIIFANPILSPAIRS